MRIAIYNVPVAARRRYRGKRSSAGGSGGDKRRREQLWLRGARGALEVEGSGPGPAQRGCGATAGTLSDFWSFRAARRRASSGSSCRGRTLKEGQASAGKAGGDAEGISCGEERTGQGIKLGRSSSCGCGSRTAEARLSVRSGA